MTSLEHAHSLFPFFYFVDLSKGMRVLVVTDHEERLGLSSDLLDISIEFLASDLVASVVSAHGPATISNSSNRDIELASPKYDLIVIDVEHDDPNAVLTTVPSLLARTGALITLSWEATLLKMIKSLPAHLGIVRPTSSHLEAGSKRWYFVVDPDLRRPRNLVRCGLRQRFPVRARFPIVRTVIRMGGFFLFTRHSVIIESRRASSPVMQLVHQLLPDYVDNGQLDRCIDSLYVSTTQVLLIRIRHKAAAYFVRFPLTTRSLERVRNQESICRHIQKQCEYSFVPTPLELPHSLTIPCSVEKALNGASIAASFTDLNTRLAQRAFASALTTIQKIHLRFGRSVRFGNQEFSAFIQPKLEYVANHLSGDRLAHGALERLGGFLRQELDGRTIIVSISHGDLKIGNCLFDKHHQVTGIVDWDMASMEDLALFDVASLRGQSARERLSLSLPQLVLHATDYADEFVAQTEEYFGRMEADSVPLQTLLWIYWLDRVYKQFRFDPEIREEWMTTNVTPVATWIAANRERF